MISPTAEYALRAVVAIAQGDRKAVVTSVLVEMTKVPPGYLPKVLQALRRAGLVHSKRGFGGGFTLARAAEQISVLDVVEVVDPIKRVERCPLHVESHCANLCPLHAKLDEAAEAVEKSFASTTIAELLATADIGQPPLCRSAKRIGLDCPPQAQVERSGQQ